MFSETPHFAYSHERGTVYGWIGVQGLRGLRLPKTGEALPVQELAPCPLPEVSETLSRELAAYFGGDPVDFSGIPLDLSPGTAFHQQVWREACRTGFGTTDTYGDLSKRLGLGTRGARAVGRALGANPIAILVPCHRFIAADGGMVNYAAGLDWKEELLRIEGAVLC